MKEKFLDWLWTPKTYDGMSPLQALIVAVIMSPLIYVFVLAMLHE